MGSEMCIRDRVLRLLNHKKMASDCLQLALPDAYIEHGNVEMLKEEIGMDADSICRSIRERLAAQAAEQGAGLTRET